MVRAEPLAKGIRQEDLMARQPSAGVIDLTIKALGVIISVVVLVVALAGGVAALVGGFRHPDLVKRTLLSTQMLTGYGREREVWLVSLGALNVCFVGFVAIVAWIGSGPEWEHTRGSPKELIVRLGIAWFGVNGLLELAHVAMGWATTLSVAFARQETLAKLSSPSRWKVVMAAMAGGGVLIDVVYMGIIAFGFGLLVAHLVSSWIAAPVVE
jgi:hypothetical protein